MIVLNGLVKEQNLNPFFFLIIPPIFILNLSINLLLALHHLLYGVSTHQGVTPVWEPLPKDISSKQKGHWAFN